MTDLAFAIEIDDEVIDVVVDDPSLDVTVTRQDTYVVAVGGVPGQPGPPGDGVPVIGEQLTGLTGTQTVFVTSHPFRANTTAVYLNGLRENFYTETGPQHITLEDPPHPDDTLHIDYVIEG